MALIETEGLSKTFRIYERDPGIKGYVKSLFSRDYREVDAVEGLDLEIDEGEVIGYIGGNGAGKSTTVKMLTGILKPSSGRIEVDGINPYRKRKKNAMKIGVVFGQKTQLWWDLPVRDSFKILKEIYKVDDEEFEERIDEFDEVLQLKDFWDQPVRKLSLGQKMRCELAAAFLHHPKIVYLDEPTIGLDVAVKERIREFIKRMNREENITVMLTTHDIGDIEDLCERVVVLDQGEKIYDGALDALVNRFTTRNLEVELAEAGELSLDAEGLVNVSGDGRNWSLKFDREKASASEIISALMDEREVLDFKLEEPDIESVVKKIYNEGLAEE